MILRNQGMQQRIPLARVHRDLMRALKAAKPGTSVDIPLEVFQSVWSCEDSDVEVKINDYAQHYGLSVSTNGVSAQFFKPEEKSEGE